MSCAHGLDVTECLVCDGDMCPNCVTPWKCNGPHPEPEPEPSPVLQKAARRPRRFLTLDSGERVDFPSGMRRDTDSGKPRYDLIPRPMLKRLAELYARGAAKYGDANWTLADSPEEVARFKASAFRHFIQWLEGERDEDHASAVAFNVFAAETIEAKICRDQP